MARTTLSCPALWLRSVKCFFATAVGLSLILAGSWARAQLPSTQLSTVFPPGGKPGTTVEVKITGADLDEVDELFFSHPGISAQAKTSTAAPAGEQPAGRRTGRRPGGQGGQRGAGGGPAPQGVPDFLVQIAPDVPPGIYEARVMGRFGVSNPRAFAVGDKPEVIEAGGNNSAEKAFEFPLGSTINARADANAVDFYKLNLAAGQRVLADCWAQRIDSRMEPTLVITDSAGKELSRGRYTIGSDALIDFTAPAEGAYLLKVYDFVYAGGADYPYRLTVHSGPQVDFVFPPSGLAGSSGQYTVYGRNLPGGQPAEGVLIEGKPLQKLAVTISLPGDDMSQQQLALPGYAPPRGALLDGIEYLLPGANAVPVYFARAPVVMEQEPNNSPQAAQKINVPCEFVGQFYPQRDVDWLEFSVQKGDSYIIETIAHRLGLNCDPAFILQKVVKNEKGEETVTDVAQVDDPGDRNNKIGTDFDTSTDDPVYRLDANEDATYRLMIRDQFGDARQDPRYVYRLVIRKLAPDFRLVAIPLELKNAADQNQQQRVSLSGAVARRGGSAVFNVLVDRRDGFKGEIAISAEELPEGVTCPGAVIGGDVDTAALVFSAAENAAPWSGPIRIVGKAQLDGKEAVRVARGGTVVWGTNNRQQSPAEFRLARDVVFSVIDKETAPVAVQVGEDKIWDTSLGANVEIPLSIVRRDGFKDPVKLVAAGLPNEIKPKEVNLDPNAAGGKLEIPLNVQNIKPGTYTFYLRADAKIKHIRNPDAITAAEEEKKQVDQLVAETAEQVKQATAAKDAAVKNATDAAAAVKKAEAETTAAATAAKAAGEAAKAAAEKAVAAKNAAAQDAGNQGLADAAAAAQKAADETAAAAKTAAEKQTAAEQALAAEQGKAKAADEAKTAAEKALKDLQDKAAQLNTQKQAADKKVADSKTANQPKDANIALASTPIKLRIAASPIGLSPAPPAAPIKAGEKTELSVELNRQYGFADAVELTFEPPAGVAGLSAAKIMVAKDQTTGKFEIAAAANATPGEHSITVRAKARFNNVNVESTEKVVVKVEAAN